jgi:hypothetical protein
VISDRNEENRGLFTTVEAPSICYMWEINSTLFSHFMCVLRISAPKTLLLTHLKNMGNVPERPSSCLSENSRGGKPVTLFHLQVRIWENERNVGGQGTVP